ncbi:hypothetical protein NMK54_01160 [Nocardia otitidiscaviarum]|uniref:hypothetical protein n=1 Tax=Nocardia otitidiscaviarum TaxID=1823 RepID=UPI001C8F3EE1|nr:hypothetical protein [Nocardia otitidiscaviarum]MCP9618771.1 hypothetical protein [Nocardia otitidiscaviarum]
MTAGPVIGVLGATGAVGSALLSMLSGHPVRPGTRVDFADLRHWATGCAVVVNCTGVPVADRIHSAGADYVDPAARPGDLAARPGDLAARPSHPATRPGDPVARLVGPAARPGGPAGPGRDERIAVYDAGAMPGAAGLLPRYLAADRGVRPARLSVTAGGLYRFTPAAAREFLATTDGWREQAARVDRALGLTGSDWSTRFDGDCVRRLLRDSVPPTVEQLLAAAAADTAGRTEYLVITAELTDLDGTVHRARLRAGPDLTATIAATTALAVLHGEIPPGSHSADDVLDPLRVIPPLLGEEGTL